MDLEQLTKHQIVLLTLLVSFVTSIATGIVTVSLMDQAPAGVTRVVNQIVEHTVERIVPSTQGAAAVVTTEKTVVVKDDDLAAQSIAAVQQSIVRITLVGESVMLARGIIIDASGVVLTDRQMLVASGKRTFDAILPSGERVRATLRKDDSAMATAVLDLAATTSAFVAASLADPLKLALGQSVIRIGGQGADTVGTGVVAMLPQGTGKIQASVSSNTPGSLLMTLFGEVIGLTTASSLSSGSDFYTTISLPANPSS